MEELTHILGFIFMIFTIVLKATVSNTNSLSFSSFPLGGNKLFSVDNVWRKTSYNSVNIFTVPITVSSVFVPSIALPKCVPADYNSTLPDFTGYKSDIWMPANGEVCSQRVSLYSAKRGAAISRSRKLKQEKLAHLVKKVRHSVFNARTWARRVRRILDIVCHWSFSFSVCLGCIREPFVLHALEEIRLALARLGRKGVKVVCGHRRKTRRRRCLLHRRYRYYDASNLIHPDRVLDYTKMPLVVHSFLGHGLTRESWHDIITLISTLDHQYAWVQLTEWQREIRLLHCVNPDLCGAGSRKLDLQWTLRIRKRVCRRMEDDEWHIIDATKTEVYQDGCIERSYSAIEYYCLGPQEI